MRARDRRGELPQRLRHEPRLQAHLRIAHVALELGAGDDVLCVASDGTVRVATVGRVKVEQRQMVLVEAEAEDGETFCALLQNAETVRLVNASGGGATSVSVLEPGDRILVHRQTGARHTGLKIEEQRWYER